RATCRHVCFDPPSPSVSPPVGPSLPLERIIPVRRRAAEPDRCPAAAVSAFRRSPRSVEGMPRAAVGGHTRLHARPAQEEIGREVLGELAGLGMAEEDGLAEGEVEPGRYGERSLHLS